MKIALSMGDPAGIGPEIVARALAEGRLTAHARITVYAAMLFGSPAVRLRIFDISFDTTCADVPSQH